MLCTPDWAFLFFSFRESPVTSFSFCVLIAALFFLLRSETRSHVCVRSNQSSARVRPRLGVRFEPSGSSLNSLLMSWGEKCISILYVRRQELFCSALTHHKNHSDFCSCCQIYLSLIHWYWTVFPGEKKILSLVGVMENSLSPPGFIFQVPNKKSCLIHSTAWL